MLVEDVGRSWGVCAASGRREEEASLHRAALPQPRDQRQQHLPLYCVDCREGDQSGRRLRVWDATF